MSLSEGAEQERWELMGVPGDSSWGTVSVPEFPKAPLGHLMLLVIVLAPLGPLSL